MWHQPEVESDSEESAYYLDVDFDFDEDLDDDFIDAKLMKNWVMTSESLVP